MSAEEKPDETLAEPAPEMVADPQPVDFQPSDAQPVDSHPEAQPPRKLSRFGWGMLAFAAIAGLGFAVAWFDVLNLKGEDKIPALQTQVEDLLIRLKATDDGLLVLQARLKATEAVSDTPSVSLEAIDALAARLGEAEAMLETISNAPALTDGSIPAASFATLVASVEALKGDVAAIKAAAPAASGEAVAEAVDQAMAGWAEAQAATAQAEVDAAKAKAAQIEAVESIRAAALSGAPYADALAALGDLAVDEPLRGKAAIGLPTQAQLTEGFPIAARTALDASLRATGADNVSDRLLNFLRVQTGARSLTAREGDDPDAVLSRAEAAVSSGDVATALTELAALPAEGQAEMAEWSALAKDYLAAQQALSALAAAVGL